MQTLDVSTVAAAFPVGEPTGPATYAGRSTWPAWRLGTDRGSYFVKVIRPGSWRDELAVAGSVERRALAAGITMPALVEPHRPALGPLAGYDSTAFVGVHEWVESSPVGTADVSEWLGRTVATLHRIGPSYDASAGRKWYDLVPPDEWQVLLDAGRRSGRPWAGPLAERLPLIVRCGANIRRHYLSFGPYGGTHRDLEPWNVRLTAAGPVLTDWDSAGPDSAALVLAHAALSFAMVTGALDEARLVAVVRAYRAAGGAALGRTDGLLSRRVAILLARLIGRLRTTLGEDTGLDPEHEDRIAVERLRELPARLAFYRHAEGLLPVD